MNTTLILVALVALAVQFAVLLGAAYVALIVYFGPSKHRAVKTAETKARHKAVYG